MSEYWVSKKKYFCKYCDIYIADDAPSRQHHESGMRHKGNVERFIRQIYKTGEKQKKDLEEEKREMKRIEQAANAAFAQDVSSGVAHVAQAPVASTSKVQKPVKPSNPFANYSTAASLGYDDPDAERIAAELERKKTQGIAGEWEVITSAVPVKSETEEGQGSEETNTLKREAGVLEDEDDTRAFKLRKKTVHTGLGEIYDPGLIPIKLKKKEPTEASLSTNPILAPVSRTETSLPPPPKWNPVQLKKSSDPQEKAGPSTAGETTSAPSTTTSSTPGSKWAKAQWSEPLPDLKGDERPIIFKQEDSTEASEETSLSSAQTAVKNEEDVKPDLDTLNEQTTSVVFKKRKAPANASRGRRQV